MNANGKLIVQLLSYSPTDLVVSDKEERTIIQLLRSDKDLPNTIQFINKQRFLSKLFDRVDSGTNNTVLVQTIAGALAHSHFPAVSKLISAHNKQKALFDRCFALQSSLRKHGLSSTPPAVANQLLKKAAARLSPTKKTLPFSGSGATGIDPKTLTISLVDKALLGIKSPATVSEYSNPIPGSLAAYLTKTTARERVSQATVLLNRKIISAYAPSYIEKLPTRADVIRSASKIHRLEPALVAAFLLAEQRDQSKNEDAKDYIAATSMLKGNTSIGLGQVVVSTAINHDLFSDLLTPSLAKALSHNDVARLLTSDEFNIFAVAKYIRHVADQASNLNISTLPNTEGNFPNINLRKYGSNSTQWPDDNIRALASEYTSRAWDDRVSPGWGYFVYEAYRDIKRSGAI